MMVCGCTTIPQDAPPYSPAPMANDDKGILYMYRLRDDYPTARAPNILIDNKQIFEPWVGAYTWIYLSPGTHKVKVDWPWDSGWPDLDFEVDIVSQKEHFLKISGSFQQSFSGFTMGSKASYIDKNIAETELNECCKFIIPNNN